MVSVRSRCLMSKIKKWCAENRGSPSTIQVLFPTNSPRVSDDHQLWRVYLCCAHNLAKVTAISIDQSSLENPRKSLCIRSSKAIKQASPNIYIVSSPPRTQALMSQTYPHEDSQSPELSEEEEEEEDEPELAEDEEQNEEDEEEGEEDGGKSAFIALTHTLLYPLIHKPRFVCPITRSLSVSSQLPCLYAMADLRAQRGRTILLLSLSWTWFIWRPSICSPRWARAIRTGLNRSSRLTEAFNRRLAFACTILVILRAETRELVLTLRRAHVLTDFSHYNQKAQTMTMDSIGK